MITIFLQILLLLGHKTVRICIQYMIPSKSGVLKQVSQFYRETNSSFVVHPSSRLYRDYGEWILRRTGFQHISIGEKFSPINRRSFSHSTIILKNKVYSVGYKMLSYGVDYIMPPVLIMKQEINIQ